MSSISALLEQTLDLIGAEELPPGQKGPAHAPSSSSGKTASSILLEEKKKIKEKMDMVTSINFNVPKLHSGPASTIFDQISTSTVEPPKYWLNNNKNHNKNNTNKHDQKAFSASKNGGKFDLLNGGNNGGNRKVQQAKSRGEDYNDRLNGKLQAKLAKQKMKNKLKG
jgi:hypothetical protein